jgi:hypothetical protein
MITRPTVFILGAGASLEYGFPTGRGLRDQIVRELRGAKGDLVRQLAGVRRSEIEDFAAAAECRAIFNR